MIPAGILPKITKQYYILPVYHTVSDVRLPYIANLYRVKNTKQFISDMDFLLKHFKPVDLYELTDIIRKNRKIKDPCFHLTFDDGLSEFYHIIAPVLLQKGIPATCFLNSAFIDSKELFFRYKESIIIEKLKREKIPLKTISGICNILGIEECAIEIFIKDIRRIQYAERGKLDDIADELDINFTDFLKEKKPYLSVKQIKDLIHKGFTFGAHSIDHPEYRYIDENDQIEQTNHSVETICKLFDLNYKVFAFPFTSVDVHKSFFNRIKADITFGCSGLKNDVIKKNLHRIPLEDSRLNAKNRIKIEYLYYLLKKPFHKNILKRD